MKNNKVIITILVAALAIALSFIAMKPAPQAKNTGASVLDGAYSYKHVSSSFAGANTVVCGGSCTLGRVVVNTTSAQIVKLYDGASTATSSATLIASLKASVGEGTYNYETVTSKGIVVEVPSGFTGSYTISYK